MARTSKSKPTEGLVYILKITLQCGQIVYKIGATSRLVRTRMGEVLLGMFDVLGYVPSACVLASDKCKDYYGAEASIHKRCKDSRYMFDVEFTGSSEFFVNLDEELVSGWIRTAEVEFGNTQDKTSLELSEIDELLTTYV